MFGYLETFVYEATTGGRTGADGCSTLGLGLETRQPLGTSSNRVSCGGHCKEMKKMEK